MATQEYTTPKARKAAPDMEELAWFNQWGLGAARSWHWGTQQGLVEYHQFHRTPISDETIVMDQSENKASP